MARGRPTATTVGLRPKGRGRAGPRPGGGRVGRVTLAGDGNWSGRGQAAMRCSCR